MEGSVSRRKLSQWVWAELRGTGRPVLPGIGDKAGQATFVEEAPTPAQSRVAYACA